MTNTLNNLRRELGQEIKEEKRVEAAAITESKNPISPIVETAPSSTPQPSCSGPQLTKEGILNLLELPFSMARMATGSECFKLNPALRDEIGARGLQLAKDYGVEFATKTMNTWVFMILYGGSLVSATAGYIKETKNAKIKTQSNKSGQSSDPGTGPERKNDVDPGSAPFH